MNPGGDEGRPPRPARRRGRMPAPRTGSGDEPRLPETPAGMERWTPVYAHVVFPTIALIGGIWLVYEGHPEGAAIAGAAIALVSRIARQR